MKTLCILILSIISSQVFSQIDSLPRIAYDFLPPIEEWKNIDNYWFINFNFDFEDKNYSVVFDTKDKKLLMIDINDTVSYSIIEDINFNKKMNKVVKNIYETGNQEHYYYKNDTLDFKYEFFEGSHITTYFDYLGNIYEMYYYEKGRAVKTEIYYTTGQLSTLFLYEKGRIISVTQFDPNGKKIEDVFVDKKGNGRWLMCSEDGTYCCDCEVKRGKTFGCEDYIEPD